jgi:hypothetical protein
MPTSVSTLLRISSELDIIGDVTAVLTGDDHRPFWAALLPEGDLAAGAVHTIPEHLASPHADHHSRPRKIAIRGSRTASPLPPADHCKATHPIVVDFIHRFAAPLTSGPLGRSRRTTRAYRHLVQVPPPT